MTAEQVESERSDRATRLDQVGWGIFLVMVGTIWLLPAVPQGTLLLATGALLLLLNVVRFAMGLRLSGIATALGILAMAAGVGEFTGIKLPLFPICLVIVGLSLIARPLVSQRA